jgi:Mg-chelatase subunit ChlD
MASSAEPLPPSYDESMSDIAQRSYVKIDAMHGSPLVHLSSATEFQANVRTPVDVIAIIDVSGSMNSMVKECVGTSTEKGSGAYTRIQLVQHAMNVVIANLSAGADYLTIITFASSAKVVFPRQQIHAASAKKACELVASIECDGMTNLYDALHTAYSYIKRHPLEQTAEQFINRHIMILSDGSPNVGHDASNLQVYQAMMDAQFAACEASRRTLLHVFGVCHDDLNDHLLSAIAKQANGMYGFMSDATIITPCVINVLAVWFNLFVTGLTLQVMDRSGQVVMPDKTVHVPWIPQAGKVTITLPKALEEGDVMHLFSNTSRKMRILVVDAGADAQAKQVKEEDDACFELRQRVAHSLFEASNARKDPALRKKMVAETLALLDQYSVRKEGLRSSTWSATSQAWLAKLVSDVDIEKRIKADALAMWSPYCLHSLACSLQDDYVTNGYEKSFKARAGPRLHHWIEEIECVAKQVTPPNPIIDAYMGDGGRRQAPVAAAAAVVAVAPPSYSYGYTPPPARPYVSAPAYDYFSSGSGRDNDDGCIAGDCLVFMADGSQKAVQDVVIGDRVRTDSKSGMGIIRCSICVPTNQYVELPGGLKLTKMHPIWYDDDKSGHGDWIFPQDHPYQHAVTLNAPIPMYSFLLESDANQPSNALRVNGAWVVHFSHESKHPILAHDFYGTQKMRDTVERLDPTRLGRIRVHTTRRDVLTDCVYDYEGLAYR